MSCYTTGNTGSQYCSAENIFGDPSGIVLAVKGFEMTAADFLDKTKWDAAINARQIFPLMGLDSFTDNSTEATYTESASEKRKLSRQGKYRFSVGYDLNQKRKQQLLNFRGFTGGVFLVYLNDTIRGRSTDAGVTIKPARVELMNVQKEKLNASGEASITMVDIDLKTEKDFNLYDYAMGMDWGVEDLDGLTEVDLAVVGTPSATSVVVSVMSSAYGKTNPIMGLVFADFDITGLSGAASAVDNLDGTYTISGTGMATGTINLVSPSTMTTTDLFIYSSGAAIVTI